MTDLLRAQEAMEIVAKNLTVDPGHFTVAVGDNGVWACAIEWGREANDSPMIGAAAYGVGATMQEAITNAIKETGWITDQEDPGPPAVVKSDPRLMSPALGEAKPPPDLSDSLE